MIRQLFMLIAVFGFFSFPAYAIRYKCTVDKKYDSERTYSKDYLDKAKFSVVIDDSHDGNVYLSRCSYVDGAGKITCDKYRADKTALDSHVKIKKYYHFSSQSDYQVFPNLTFIENNGRGGIAYGKCEVTSP